jgi:flagellar secretion chaperone FliS
MNQASLPRATAAVAAKYKTVQVSTCSPAQLVLLLLEGAIRFAAEADTAIAAGDRARAGERIGRCHAVLEELAAGLDMTDTTGLCDNLLGVYSFAMRRLIDANLKQDREILAEVPRVVRPIREAWAQLLGKP